MTDKDTRIWLTGASTGIGAALAKAWAAQGAKLVLSARQVDQLTAVAAACRELGATAKVLPLDLAAAESRAEAARRAQEIFGGLDLLVNNAGLSQRCLAREAPLGLVRQILEVNFFAAVELTQAVLPGLIAQGRGRIVVISSVQGKFGAPHRSGYAASKHALHGYFDSLRHEISGTGVGVTLVCPGFVRTEISRHALDASGRPRGVSDAQLHGLTADECARRILTGLAAGRDEFNVGGWELGAIWLKRFAPGLLNWAVGRFAPRE